MSRYQVRPATLRDAKAIAQVHVASAQAAYQGLMPDAHLKALSVEKRQAFWREAIDLCEPQVLVATEADQVVGFVGFDRSRDKGTPATTGEIWALYARPDLWDTGLGAALWEAARDGLLEEGCTKATLWSLWRNERALSFFDEAGFKIDKGSARTTEVGGSKLEEIRLQRSII
jgi:GNAT superfamily N-acetyltransferase